MKPLTCGLVVLTLVAGCSSMKVQTDHLPEADFSAFETFMYVESDTTLAESDPLAHGRIVAAIRREMTAAGLTEVEANPDVDVTYYAAVDQQVQFQTTYMAGGWSRRGWRGAFSTGTSTTRPVTFEQGTLVIDVWEVAENQLVWRGVVTDTLGSNPQKNADRVNRGIARVFEDFPPN